MVGGAETSGGGASVTPISSAGPSDGARPGILARLRAAEASLTPTGRRIAAFILAQPEAVVHMSITQAAETVGVSEGSIVALCQQMGARGFQQLKILLAQEQVAGVQFIHEDLERGDDTAAITRKIFASNAQALNDTLGVLDLRQMARAVAAIRAARRVELYGIGSAAPVVEDAHYRLMRIGIDVRLAVDSHVQAISASQTGPGVVTLTVSHSGSTHETLAATRLAREAGATTICITSFARSPIVRFTDILLATSARETQFRTEAMTSRIAQLAIVDALVAGMAMADYDRAVDTITRTFDTLSIKRL